jgi:hypothetical protein
MRDAIAIFAKAAIPGRVKTRLQPALPPVDAARLYRACVEDSWALAQQALPDGVYLFSDRRWPAWVELAGEQRFRLQSDGDLGARLFDCFERLAADGFERILILGGDSPTLPPDLIRQGFDALASIEDAVLGPSEDGGYYAVGCRRPRPDMFEQVSWSSETTLQQTVHAFERAGFSIHTLKPWWDLDTPADLDRLLQEPALGPQVAAWAQNR